MYSCELPMNMFSQKQKLTQHQNRTDPSPRLPESSRIQASIENMLLWLRKALVQHSTAWSELAENTIYHIISWLELVYRYNAQMNLNRFSHLCAYMNSLSKENIKVCILMSVMLPWPAARLGLVPEIWAALQDGVHGMKDIHGNLGKQSVVYKCIKSIILEASDSQIDDMHSCPISRSHCLWN